MKPIGFFLLLIVLAACTTLPGSVSVSGDYSVRAIAGERKSSRIP